VNDPTRSQKKIVYFHSSVVQCCSLSSTSSGTWPFFFAKQLELRKIASFQQRDEVTMLVRKRVWFYEERNVFVLVYPHGRCDVIVTSVVKQQLYNI